MALPWWAVFCVFAFRLFSSFIVRTHFAADEYYQSLEVAHSMVFGYGHLTWEWQAENALRSVLYPALFAAPMYLLKVGRDVCVCVAVNVPMCVVVGGSGVSKRSLS